MKSYVVKFTTQARRDLLEIGDFIALDSPARTERFISEIISFAESLLSSFPHAARKKYTKYPTVRMIPYRKYNIYYRIRESENAVEVLHIYNGAKRSPFE